MTAPRNDLEPRRIELLATIAWQRVQLGTQVALLKRRLSPQAMAGAVRERPAPWVLAAVAAVAAAALLPRVAGRLPSMVRIARSGVRWWMLGRLAWRITSQWRRPAAAAPANHTR